MKVLRTFSSNNPYGISIEDGWLALAAAVYGDLSAEEAILRVCGHDAYGFRDPVKVQREKQEAVMEAYNMNPGLSNSELARLIGCTRELVRQTLKHNGIRRPSRQEIQREKQEAVMEAYNMNPGLNNSQLARLAGCTRAMVRRTLEIKGIRRPAKTKTSGGQYVSANRTRKKAKAE